MNIKEDIKPISYIKTNAADMLKRVNDTHHPMIITQNGEAKAVLLDTETYQSMINSIGILKIMSQSEKDIEKGEVIEQEQLFNDVDKKLRELQKMKKWKSKELLLKKAKVVWTDTAVRDLEDRIDYISLDSVKSAVEQYKKIKKATRYLTEVPKSGRIIPELYEQNITKYRETIITPWRIMYKEEQNVVYIMAIIDGKRNIEDILMRRNIR